MSQENPANATTDIESHELYRFSQLFHRVFKTSKRECVTMDYKSDIEQLQRENTTLAKAFRPWFYQTCSEFGWYQTTDSEDQPFGTKSPIEFYLTLCKDIFGDMYV